MQDKQYFKIKTSFANYYLQVQHYVDDEDFNYMDKIILGSKTKCMVMSVYLDGDAPNIDAIAYGDNCNEAGTHKRHIGTIHMIKCGISFVRNIYRNYLKKYGIQTIILKDKSSIQCYREYEQSLPYFYIAKHGKTWYEKHLGAVPETNIERYKQDKQKLVEALKTKPTLKFKMKGLDAEYEKHKSIGTFIKHITNNYDCIALKGWFQNFLEEYLPYLVGMRWNVVLEDNSIDIMIESLSSAPQNTFIMRGASNLFDIILGN